MLKAEIVQAMRSASEEGIGLPFTIRDDVAAKMAGAAIECVERWMRAKLTEGPTIEQHPNMTIMRVGIRDTWAIALIGKFADELRAMRGEGGKLTCPQCGGTDTNCNPRGRDLWCRDCKAYFHKETSDGEEKDKAPEFED
jgi:hypothetical protein